jgi:hypothetical protein
MTPIERRSLLQVSGIAFLGALACGVFFAIENAAEYGPGHTWHLIVGGGHDSGAGPGVDAPDAVFDLSNLSQLQGELHLVDTRIGQIQYILDQLRLSSGDYSHDPRFLELNDALKDLESLKSQLTALQSEVAQLDSMMRSDQGPEYEQLRQKVLDDIVRIHGTHGLSLTQELAITKGEYAKGQTLLTSAEPGTVYKDGQWIDISKSGLIDVGSYPHQFPIGTGNRLLRFAGDVGGIRLTDGFPADGSHGPGSLHFTGQAVDVVPWHGLGSPDQVARDLLSARKEGFTHAMYEAPSISNDFALRLRRALEQQLRRRLSDAEFQQYIDIGGTGPHLHLSFTDDPVQVLAGGPGS